MALLHLTPLFQGNVTAGAVRTIYTVPAGDRVNLRNVVMSNRSAAAQTVTLSLNGQYIVAWFGLAAAGGGSSSATWSGWLVLAPGTTITFNVQTGSCDVLCSGSIYTI